MSHMMLVGDIKPAVGAININPPAAAATAAAINPPAVATAINPPAAAAISTRDPFYNKNPDAVYLAKTLIQCMSDLHVNMHKTGTTAYFFGQDNKQRFINLEKELNGLGGCIITPVTWINNAGMRLLNEDDFHLPEIGESPSMSISRANKHKRQLIMKKMIDLSIQISRCPPSIYDSRLVLPRHIAPQMIDNFKSQIKQLNDELISVGGSVKVSNYSSVILKEDDFTHD
jgi:hypothetical protein